MSLLLNEGDHISFWEFWEFWEFYRPYRVFGCFIGVFFGLFVFFWAVFVFLSCFRVFYLTMGVVSSLLLEVRCILVFSGPVFCLPSKWQFWSGLAATSLRDYELWACYIILRFVSVLFCIWWGFFCYKFAVFRERFGFPLCVYVCGRVWTYVYMNVRGLNVRVYEIMCVYVKLWIFKFLVRCSLNFYI